MADNYQRPNYKTVRQFAGAYPAFSQGSLRDLIFFADFNGLSKFDPIRRVGAKVLINVDKFFQWVDTNPKTKGGING